MSSIAEALKKAGEGEKRNFKQTYDLAINLKNIDMKKPESKIKTEILLPNPLPKKVVIGVFADMLVPQAKQLGEDIVLIKKAEITDYDKKAMKGLANKCAAFLAEAPLMPLVGKHFGPVLAVRNKMPKPIPPTLENIAPLVERTKNTVRIAMKESPVIHCAVGTEEMDPEKVLANIDTVMKAIEALLPKGREQIKNACIKLTMGKPAKFDMKG